ncbi:CoA-acylating methylmalonate-semialdehyde dehydrogenase [Alteromonas lipolytica]|uniref:methylmalonate-semialdehyde dehydrogenase (CoA acylating) n=1 Tax=Alteromonas lipolytica TaxID=1856405 RepID=A0A1E8FGN2_9ALTE|nr:CoA-acylating methylmalonate-semialdehyde dehydrogenase [Alteromonas lipolytica]OFI35102.1 methylmalonate-semialdehyde dehydrogenase (acylating) [Alteromonas lipolytica]GGF56686.1 methylmalonate-semialdehyde dehydrogenase (acylating) [Alteromonas lipolytica]
MHNVKLFIDGEFKNSASLNRIPVTNPASAEIIAYVPDALAEEADQAVAAAKKAFQSWKAVPVTERARVMMRYQAILKREQTRIASVLAAETGKVFDDAMGDAWRGIEVVEQAMNAPGMMMGETVENVAQGIDTYSMIQPLGVCVGITPFNFPAMIPLWMFPLAIACGNTFVLKPSEQDPQTPMLLAELFVEAGAPPGVLNIIHGGRERVDQLLHHDDVAAVSFVGSVPVGQHVYRTATANLKRAQCFAGAKNHTVVMPDASKNHVINNLVGASVGAAGQRCMAISVAIFVGESQQWIDELAQAIAAVKPGLWNDKEAGFGPLISASAKERVVALIESGKAQGATCLVDGSDFTVAGYEQGHWIGPTVFRDVTTDMRIYQEEIFGPVLCCLCVDSLDEALAIVNANPYGNGTSIFTASGAAARKYQSEVSVGQVGINVPIPVPLPFFSFTGWKNSFFGDLHAYGKQAVRFYTETKTITSRWPEDSIPAGPNLTINLR